MSVFEAAMPEEVSAPYRSALRRLTDAQPAMSAEVARRIVAADLAVAYGPGWRQRLVAFGGTPVAAASIGQVHRGQWRDDRGRLVEVAGHRRPSPADQQRSARFGASPHDVR
jgi:predicted unusual protein kinase regulating ubiquinone biosynthesis (AarF/ABC1/UbiB family)